MGSQMDDFVAKVVDQDGDFCNIDATRVPNTDRAIPNVAFDRTIDTAHAASAASIDGKLPALPAGDTVYPMAPDNVKSFGHTFPTGSIDYSLWTPSAGAGAIIQNDGNCIASSYLVMSLDPRSPNSESSVVTTQAYKMPIELALGIHSSQVGVGQEFYVEVVTADEVTNAFAELAISSIQQATTTLTIGFATPHNLKPGMRVGVYGVTDTRLNYAALIVGTVPTDTTFTVTTSESAALPSLTVGPFATGFVYYRPALGYCFDGASMSLANNLLTNAAFYLRSGGGDVHPITASPLGTQQTTVATRASVQPFAQRACYNFQPTSEVRMSFEPGRVEWSDVPVDSVAAATMRATRTQLTPNSSKSYKLRFRAINTKSMSFVAAQIVSISKTGSTTATVTTNVDHNLTTSNQVGINGVRDITNFPTLATGTVLSTPTSTTFTVVIGGAVTATSYGGAVTVINGATTQIGAIAQAIQSASSATSSGRLTVIGNAAWAGLLIGDYVNAIGVRLSTDGSPVNSGVDGAYRVFNVSGTTLELEPLSGTPTPTDFTTVNCGGAIVKRTDLRISFAKLNAFKRNRVEIMPRPAGDMAAAIPVVLNGTPAVTVTGTITTVTTVTAVTSANLAIPGIIQDVASAAITATATTAAITPTFGIGYKVVIPVTAMSGTTPTMDVGVEESDDTGTNWFRVYDFQRITGTGVYRSPPLVLSGNRIRYVQTIGGTSPSFTRSVQRLQRSDDAEPFRQLIDRAIALGTLNSATPILNTVLCRQFQLIVSVGTIATTAPQVQLEGSDDGGASWYDIGTPLTAVASSTVQVTTTSDFNAALVRARVSTAGVGVAAASWYVLVKGF